MSAVARRNRIAAVDAARGIAILGMVAFHLAWDLHFFGLSDINPAQAPAWRIFGDVVASVFLFLSGFGLVLAQKPGAPAWAALRRIGVIAVAAATLTLATAIAAPGQVIRFGILHCIALSNLLALPLLRRPPLLVAIAASAAFLAPFVAPRDGFPSLWWLGLSDRIPATLDARPLMPWLGLVLLGVLFGQTGGAVWLRRRTPHDIRGWGVLGMIGRHSLLIYLVHQPLMFGMVAGVSAVTLSQTEPAISDAGPAFTRRCEAECAGGRALDQCAALCACVRSRIGDGALASAVPTATVAETAAACMRRQTNP